MFYYVLLNLLCHTWNYLKCVPVMCKAPLFQIYHLIFAMKDVLFYEAWAKHCDANEH